jgi:iron complex transport system ATP-binding protein
VAVLEASDIVVNRAGRDVLGRVSLKAAASDFIAVIGANGAGKSTLLRVLTGLLAPDSGGVSLDGVPIRSISHRNLARRRAYLPQNARCEWPISVERLVTLGLTPTLPAFGGLPASYDRQITTALQECDLEDHRKQPVTTLSGGELARAMLARALIGNPDVLILDEPVAGLDPKHAFDTARRLQALARSGKVVIASIHDLTLVGRHATRVFALENGRVVGDGPTELTLTPQLIRAAFDVDARVLGEREKLHVDYVQDA